MDICTKLDGHLYYLLITLLSVMFSIGLTLVISMPMNKDQDRIMQWGTVINCILCGLIMVFFALMTDGVEL
jgi:hypothetical protein